MIITKVKAKLLKVTLNETASSILSLQVQPKQSSPLMTSSEQMFSLSIV